MRFSKLRTAWKRLSGAAISPGGCACGVGGLSGLYLLACCQQFIGNLGTTLPVITALGFAAAIGCTWGLRAGARPFVFATPRGGASRSVDFNPRDAANPLATYGLIHFILAAWTVAMPWFAQLVSLILQVVPAAAVASPIGLFVFAFPVATLTVGVPVFLMARLPSSLPQYLAGVAVGLLAALFFLAPILGAQNVGLLAAGISGFLFLRSIVTSVTRRASVPACSERDKPGDCSTAGLVTHHSALATARTAWMAVLRVWTAAMIGCLGALFGLLSRLLSELMPATSFLIYSEWAALLAGLALGLWWRDRHRRVGFQPARNAGEVEPNEPDTQPGRTAWKAVLRHSGNPSTMPGLAVAVWSVTVFAAFPLLVRLMLLLNAHVSHVWLLVSGRSLLTAIVLAPVGIGWGCVAVWQKGTADDGQWKTANARAGLPRLSPLAFAAGFLFVRWAALLDWRTADLLVAVTAVMAVMPMALDWSARGLKSTLLTDGLQPARRSVVRWGVALGTIAAAVMLRGMYDPAHSAKLLFATNVFVQSRSGLLPQSLIVADEGRAIALREGSRGTFTLWKYRGAQWHLRESGVPVGVISADTRFHPQFSGEVLPVALPLVLHPRPHRVLLLGMGSGVPLTTALSFPVQEVTCAEGDSSLVKLLREQLWSASPANPFVDQRFRYLALEPAVAVAVGTIHHSPLTTHHSPATEGSGLNDVVVSCPGQAALLRATPEFTLEFYERAARGLTPDGIFCQRFQQVDFGPRPLRTAVKTLSGAFRHVAAVETAPGEVALLGTNSDKGFVRGNLTARLQRPHVRRALSRIGWDWSVVLDLSAFDQDALVRFVRQQSTSANTVANARFAFRLPQEVMRWGPKWQELQEGLGEHRRPLLAWLRDDDQPNDRGSDNPVRQPAERPALSGARLSEVQRRLAEVADQRRLMTFAPDEYWAYRKTVRDRITTQPRSVIQQVSGEFPSQGMHPDDKRRMSYFAALGEAVRQRPPRSEDIRRVAAFAEPYDPILSYFVHQEAAELYARAGDRDVAAELLHRLHAIYFADANDRSVRNVTAAIKLLASHPEVVPDPAERFDHLNGLLQVLKQRWDARGAATPLPSRIVLNDIEKSIDAVETAFAAMDELAAAAAVPQSAWQARQTYLDRELIRPLRTYRSRLLPQHVERRTGE